MRVTAPLCIGPRLMAAAQVGDGGGALHIEPVGRDGEDRVVWRYVIEDRDGTVLDDGADLRSGAGDPVDPRKALGTLVGFLGVAADEYRAAMHGHAPYPDVAGPFPPNVMEWAYMHDDELASLSLDLQEPEVEAPVRRPNEPFLRPVGSGDPVPPGWTAQPAGEWNGQEIEVVLNPRRHAVMVADTSAIEDREGDLAANGWEYQGTDGYRVMWVRDRVAAARTALDRQATAPAPETGSPGPEVGGLGQ